MGDRSKQTYRHAPAAVLTKVDGTAVSGRGFVTRMKAQSGEFMPYLPAETGRLCQPLFVFTGWLPGTEAGDSIQQAGERYRVLSAEDLGIGGTKICLRAVCEKEDAVEGT